MQKIGSENQNGAQKVEYVGTPSGAKAYVSLRICDAAVDAYFRGQKDVRMRITAVH